MITALAWGNALLGLIGAGVYLRAAWEVEWPERGALHVSAAIWAVTSSIWALRAALGAA